MIATEMLNAFAESWIHFMIGGLVDAGILLVLLCLLWLLLYRRVSAQFGYCLFLLVLFRVVLPLPVTLPPWCKHLSPTHMIAQVLQTSGTEPPLSQRPVSQRPTLQTPVSQRPTMTDDVTIVSAGDPSHLRPSQPPVFSTTDAAAPQPPLSAAAQVMLVWGAIVVCLLAWTLVIQRRLWRVLRRATEIKSERFEFDFDELRRRVGVRQPVTLLTSNELVSPAVAGLWRPRILLPANFADILSPPQLRWVILHELAHIQRRDLWLAAFQKTVQIVHFFNPAIWLTNWIIDRQREYACDDVGLTVGDVPRRECAAAFLSILEGVSRRPKTGPSPLNFLRSPNPFRRRLMRILDTNRPLRPRLTWGAILALTVIASFVVPQLRPAAWAQNEGTSSERDSQSRASTAGQDNGPPGRSQSPAESGPPPRGLENRLESLENEVRQLRKVLQDLAAAQHSAGSSARTAELFAPVKRMDLAIVNRQGEVVVVSPIKNLSRSGSHAIIKNLAPNGSQVNEGDPLGELDSESLRNQLNVVAITREKAKAETLQAAARLSIQLNQNQATLAQDQLQLELAKLELQAYTEATFPLELKKLKARVEDAETTLAFAQRTQQPKGSVKKAELQLSIALSDLEKLQKFERALQIKRLEGALNRAITTLERSKRDSEARVSEAIAIQDAAIHALGVADAKLKSMQVQIDKCKLLAPVQGIVHYSNSFIKPGAVVRERQPILSIAPLSVEREKVLKDILVVPAAAVRGRGEGTSCLVETPQGLEQRTVQLGRSNSSFVEVLDGLKVGDRVLLGRVNLTDPPGRSPTGTSAPRRTR